jgi:hypothetical protein
LACRRSQGLKALLRYTNRLAQAEPLMRRALEIHEKAYGPDHPDVAIDLSDLAGLLKDTNRLAQAEPLMRRALAIDEKSLGPDHPRTKAVRRNYEVLLKEIEAARQAPQGKVPHPGPLPMAEGDPDDPTG